MAPIRAVHGFTYVGVLFLVVLIGVLLSAAGLLWQTETRREKELQLLFVGRQYQEAIASYHAVQVNGASQYPPSIDALLEDRRFLIPTRHLRKRYIDPVANSDDWGLVRDAGGIVAVYSLSEEEPIKRDGFPPCCESFANAKHYSDWRFTSRPRP